MGAHTHIEWTDHTFNPWEGCTKVSPGCTHCYAESRNQRYSRGANWGPGAPRRRTSANNWNEPIRWNKKAEEASRLSYGTAPRPRVFCASLADIFDIEVPDQWRMDMWALIEKCPWLDWQLLTKRPQYVEQLVPMAWLSGHWPANVWLGTTVEDQRRADERIPILLTLPAPVRFLSCEPLLTALDVNLVLRSGSIHWVICGGESGPQARPMDPTWARGLRDQCQSAGVPFLFKQWGESVDNDNMPSGIEVGEDCSFQMFGDNPVWRIGKVAAGRELDGVEWSQFPKEVA